LNHRFPPCCLFLVLALAALVGNPRPAIAAGKDAAAIKLAEDAINNDYLATNFAEAEKKLRRATTLCGATGCTPQTRARIFRDLGVVLVAGMNRVPDGRAAFAEAIKIDPGTALEKDLTTPEVEQAFQAAKGSAAGTSGKGASGAGDIVHTPPSEQAVLTPVPLYLELPEGVKAAKVIARYRPFGAPEWKTLELRKTGDGYGGEIPCLDIGSTSGDLAYYLQATDAGGDIVATSGTRTSPHKVAIKTEIASEPPHLPGRSAPAACRDAADCPPGLPGCPARRIAGKAQGANCDQDAECGPGLACTAGTCQVGDKSSTEAVATRCETDSDCESGEKCSSANLCERPHAQKKTWLSLSLQQDFVVSGEQRDICRLGHDAQFVCTDQDGFIYSGSPRTDGGDTIKSSTARSTIRLLVGVDRVVGTNTSLGLRAGYAFNVAEPASISAVHGEVRFAYWFGSSPFQRRGLRPYVGAAAGLASMDVKFAVPIREQVPKPEAFLPETQTLSVFRKSGPGFAGLLGGVMIPFGADHGLLVEVQANLLFPYSGFGISPRVGYTLGL
jgi:hypothetical protein